MAKRRNIYKNTNNFRNPFCFFYKFVAYKKKIYYNLKIAVKYEEVYEQGFFAANGNGADVVSSTCSKTSDY